MALQLVPFRPISAFLGCPTRVILSAVSVKHQQVRGLKPNKHMSPQFKNLRRLKISEKIPVKYQKDMSLAIKDGMMQNFPVRRRTWRDRDMYVSTSNQVADQFVPPENDLVEGLTQDLKNKWNNIGSAGRDKLALRKLRSFEPEFNLQIFQEEAKDIYIKAHECLAANDHEKLTDYVTESARFVMLSNVMQRTIRWKYLQSLEEPKVVQIRAFKVDDANNTFSQITLRLFSQQTLAIYDRFGRLVFGSEVLAKDVLEYLVFEKHLSNEYGAWRLHAKIIPDNCLRMADHTYVVPKESQNEIADTVLPESEVSSENSNTPETVKA